MRRVIAVALVAAAAAILWSCGAPGSSGGGGAGGGLLTTTVSATTGSGPALLCTGALPGMDICSQCLEKQCCDAVIACKKDSQCAACLSAADPDPAVCSGVPAVAELRSCGHARCPDTCASWRLSPACDAPEIAPSGGECLAVDGELNKCNPITNEGCEADQNESCGADEVGFRCFAQPALTSICQDCGDAAGNQFGCAGGLTCVKLRCQRFCCGDGDCGTGSCVKGAFAEPSVGVCSGE